MLVFDPVEQHGLAADSQLSIYAALTTDQVIGLIDACGNYLARRTGLEPDELSFESLVRTPEIAAAHRTFVECCRQTYLDPSESLPDGHGPLVFTSEEQARLRLYKYTRGSERITRSQLVDLLRAVRVYSEIAVPSPLQAESANAMRPVLPGLRRYLHAHNWVIRFGREAFTDSEFRADLYRSVLSRNS